MPAPLRLEVFSAPDRSSDAPDPGAEAREELRSAAYEDGYAAGWEDALAQTADEAATRRMRAEEALQALCFGQAEAQAQALAALRPLIACMVTRVLPALARDTLAPLVAQEIERIAAARLPAPLELICSPELRDDLEALAARIDGLRLSVRTEPSYGPGQVRLECGDTGTDVDLDATLASISAAVDDFFDTHPMPHPHGQETTANG